MVPEMCAELDDLTARREKAMLSPGCPPDLVAVSDRMRELRSSLAACVRDCQAQVLDVARLKGLAKIPDAQVELLYFTSWALLKSLEE